MGTSRIIAEATLISLILLPRLVRGAGNETTSSEALASQWLNPVDISTILLVIGGDVVQKALAQSTGKRFTPVCFSFGWVTYAFIALIGVIGDGKLLPPPDYPVKVFNLTSGYVRENKNWVIGRILRDIEADLAEQEPLNDYGIRISFYKAAENKNAPTGFSYSRMHLFGLICIIIQLALAALPIILNGEWDIMLITGAGTILAQIAGSLPQWRAEKLPNRQGKEDTFALTQGNGCRDIIVIQGCGNCLDLEEMSVAQSPRLGRPWEKFDPGDFFPMTQTRSSGFGELARKEVVRSRDIGSFPVGFWVTRIVCVVQSVLWLLLLINVATPRNYNWVLLAIGCLGMFQNGFIAAMSRSSGTRNLPLLPRDTIRGRKVMDGIMDFHVSYRKAGPLLHEFFPGKLRPDEKDWWSGKPGAYDETREKEGRGLSRRYQPPYRSTLGSTVTPDDIVILEGHGEKIAIDHANETLKQPHRSNTATQHQNEVPRPSPSIPHQLNRNVPQLSGPSSSGSRPNENRVNFTDTPVWAI